MIVYSKLKRATVPPLTISFSGIAAPLPWWSSRLACRTPTPRDPAGVWRRPWHHRNRRRDVHTTRVFRYRRRQGTALHFCVAFVICCTNVLQCSALVSMAAFQSILFMVGLLHPVSVTMSHPPTPRSRPRLLPARRCFAFACCMSAVLAPTCNFSWRITTVAPAADFWNLKAPIHPPHTPRPIGHHSHPH